MHFGKPRFPKKAGPSTTFLNASTPASSETRVERSKNAQPSRVWVWALSGALAGLAIAGLDLGGRELLVAALADLAADPSAPPVVLVTHHAEDVPPGFTHGLLLRDGRVVAEGPLGEVLADGPLSHAFGLPLRVERRGGGRYATHAG